MSVLTYHRIVEGGGRRGFYDVTRRRFAEHLDLLASPGPAAGHEPCLTFDDGTADHLEVAGQLRGKGLSGTFFVIVGRLGWPGYLTTSQVGEIAAMGHRIGSHTITHRALPDLSPAELEIELRDSRRRLEDLAARPVDWLALPGGYGSTRCLEAASHAGYAVVRTMEWGYAGAPLHGSVPCLPIRADCDARRLRRILEGRARVWPYRIKERIKVVLGERLYVGLRDRLALSHDRRQVGKDP
jgi:peptidoglycan/xylan/chitin deacetylase (PgdA/CDA1 family)